MIIALFLSLPIGISREVLTYDFNLTESNTVVSIHTYGKIKLETN